MARRNQDEEANAPFGRYISDRIIFWLDRWRPITASRHDLLYNQRRSRQGRRSRWIGRCRCALPVAGTDCWRGQQDPGVLTSAQMDAAARTRLMRVTVSGMVHGRTPKVLLSQRASPISTATT